MAVTFVIGRAGSGKTRHCFTAIVDALRRRPIGPRIFWLLPRQATFSAERELTCNSGLGGFVRAQVLSFEQLGHEIIRECGGASIPRITPLGRQMILGHLLRRHAKSLKHFRDVARQPGLAAKLDATYGEFERCGKDASDLQQLLGDMTGGMAGGTIANHPLRDKVHDLHLIYEAYTSYLGQDRLDQHQRLLHVLASLGNCNLFHEATVYVDGFLEFTEYERRILARLGKVCRCVVITLPMDPRSIVIRQPDLFPDELSLFHPVEMAFRRLRMVFREEGTPVDEPVTLLTNIHRFKTAALQAIEKHGFGTAVIHVQRSDDGVELLEAPTREVEVDAAARRIKRFLQSGLRLRDIAVLVRDLSDYHDLIAASFAEHGIRYFVDRRRQTSHHPLIQFVRAILEIARQTWPHEWMMMLLKTGLTGIPEADGDALENYVLAHGISGEQWAAAQPWQYHGKDRLDSEEATEKDPRDVDLRRRALVEGIKPFLAAARGPVTVREIVAALFAAIERFPVRATLTQWIAAANQQGDFEQMSEHTQVWADLSALFDQMVELLGDEVVTLSGFQEILEAGLEQFDLGLTPPTVDEVLVGQVDRTRPPALRAVLVLGLAEGCFPRVPRDDTVLSDADRLELHGRKLDVLPISARRLLDENLLGYSAFTSASETLHLSRPLADAKGNPLGPSDFFRRIERMFQSRPLTVLTHDRRGEVSSIGTVRQLVTGLMRWVRDGGATDAQDANAAAWPALYQWFATCPMSPPAMDETSSGAIGMDSCPCPLPDPEDTGMSTCPWHPIPEQLGTAVARARSGAWRALRYKNDATLSAAVGEKLFHNPLGANVAQLETFAACPFQHFARHGLQLRPRDEGGEVSSLDLGRIYHQVLEQVAGNLLRQNQNWPDLDPDRQHALIDQSVERISRSLRNEVMLGTGRSRHQLQRIRKNLERVVDTQKAQAGRGRFRTAFARVAFGEGGDLPEFTLPTPKGRELRLSGRIDRVDLHAERNAVVIDYRMSNKSLGMAQVYHGLSLELLTCLVVLEAGGEALIGRPLTPAAAFYMRVLRSFEDCKDPADAPGPDQPGFHLAAKPRGLIDDRFLTFLDLRLGSGEQSEVVKGQLDNDGNPSRKPDLADNQQFSALLAHVRRRLAELTDGILDGDTAIAPYMLGKTTPCPQCGYRSICRFESRDGYFTLRPMRRDEVMQVLINGEERR